MYLKGPQTVFIKFYSFHLLDYLTDLTQMGFDYSTQMLPYFDIM